METSARFWLSENNETARVKFLLDKWEDVNLCHIHEIKVENKDGTRGMRRIRCLGDNCIACKRGNRLITKVYIPLYNETLQKVQFWERTPVAQFLNFNIIFRKHENVPAITFEIRRIGNKGDIHTRYEIVEVKGVEEKLPKYDTIPNIAGNFYDIVDEYSLRRYLDKELEILRLRGEEDD